MELQSDCIGQKWEGHVKTLLYLIYCTFYNKILNYKKNFHLDLCVLIADETDHSQVIASSGKEKTRNSMKLIRFIGMRVYRSIIDMLDIKMY